MTTTIRTNGSKRQGQAPDDPDAFLDVLKRHPLEGCFAPFVRAPSVTPDRIAFHAKFRTVSHVFRIETYDAELIANLTAAIIVNVLRPDDERVATLRTGT